MARLRFKTEKEIPGYVFEKLTSAAIILECDLKSTALLCDDGYHYTVTGCKEKLIKFQENLRRERISESKIEI